MKRIAFCPVPSKEVKEAMGKLVLAGQVSKDDVKIPALTGIPCVIADFLSIHRFSAGNGRLSRLLTSLLLYKEGFDIGKYISFENQINICKGSYYFAFERAQSTWHENSNSYAPLHSVHLPIALTMPQKFDRRFIVNKSGKQKKNE